ncbi:sigma-70 family RNA polymerase sigma factor [Bacillus sp. B15-48]|nr:sigma-70 family RNA polymerase sigma factor [Bacillus sp. B15-48]MBM4764402.1 sigma-70 family RNA polymerase sigma factor [Bacillus sp. B15-48]
MDLVDRLLNKEEAALVELMNQYGDYLLRTALLFLKDQQVAEETVQDVFITAYEKINQLTDSSKLKSWLTSILVNRCRTEMRKRSWKQRLLSLNMFDFTQQDDLFLGPEEHLFALAENQHLTKAIHALDYKYREVIVLFYYNEMKITDIAEFIQTKENTVKSRLARGRSLLKDSLMKGEDDRER